MVSRQAAEKDMEFIHSDNAGYVQVGRLFDEQLEYYEMVSGTVVA